MWVICFPHGEPHLVELQSSFSSKNLRYCGLSKSGSGDPEEFSFPVYCLSTHRPFRTLGKLGLAGLCIAAVPAAHIPAR